MTLSYPLEIYDSSRLKGRLQVLQPVSVLFPSYLPKTTSDVKKYFEPIENGENHIEALLVRYGKTNVYGLISTCEEFAFNHYLFPNISSVDVIEYITKNEGWTPRLYRSIKQSHKYFEYRVDRADALYVWEETNISKTVIPFSLAEDILEKELQLHAIPYDFEIKEMVDKTRLGYCSIFRKSGWLGSPYKYEFGLRRKPYLHIVLHELAHAFDAYYYRTNSHGPTFMLLYRDLLLKYTGIDYLQSMTVNGLYRGKHGKA